MATMAGRGALSGERLFYLGMAAAIFAIIVAGFGPSYYFRPLTGRPAFLPMTPLVHLHGLIFSAWLLLFVVQTCLISGRRLDLHRRMGPLALALVLLMIVVATLSALHGVHRASGPPGIPPLSWLAVPLIGVPAFAGLILAALRHRAAPATHKRLMLLAMVAMVPPATGRMFQGPAALAGPLLLILAMVVRDLMTLRRVHRATLWGGGVVVVSIVLPMLIWDSRAWLAFARWAAGLVA